jgi:hypothetical protein
MSSLLVFDTPSRSYKKYLHNYCMHWSFLWNSRLKWFGDSSRKPPAFVALFQKAQSEMVLH